MEQVKKCRVSLLSSVIVFLSTLVVLYLMIRGTYDNLRVLGFDCPIEYTHNPRWIG